MEISAIFFQSGVSFLPGRIDCFGLGLEHYRDDRRLGLPYLFSSPGVFSGVWCSRGIFSGVLNFDNDHPQKKANAESKIQRRPGVQKNLERW